MAPRDGTYGCCGCGAYARRKKGDKLDCRACRSAKPLIDVVDVGCSPADGTQAPLQSTQATGKR